MQTQSGGRGPLLVYVAKGSRVYVSGLLSVLIPAYLRVLGYSPFFVGLALTLILVGNALSNILLTYFDRTMGRKRLLQVLSLLMLAAGLLLALVNSPFPILLACFLGNISTTGTEAGPFQAVEVGIIPDLVGRERTVRTLGIYNLVGYTASALGAFTLYLPGSQGNSIGIFQALFLGFGAVGVLLFVLYTRLKGVDLSPEAATSGLAGLEQDTRKDVLTLSSLYSLDAFGGSFASQYLLSYWFTLVFGVPYTTIALIFLTTNVISGVSAYFASFIAERIGNLRTMVFTHAVSSVFLLLVAVAGSLAGAVVFLFLRQSLSQMDVPTRQALMVEMFRREDRVTANAVTNTVRSVGAALGGPVSAALLNAGLATGIIYSGGISKLAYDGLIFIVYRKKYK